MVSSASGLSGLSAADISTLFKSSSDPATSGARQITPTPPPGTKPMIQQITGANPGNDAVKAIQSIATQIEIEKLQVSAAGKTVFSLTSASVAITSGGTPQSAGTPDYDIDTGVTDLHSVTTATAATTTSAVLALHASIDAQIAEVRQRQGGALTTKFEQEFDDGPSNTLIVASNGTATNTTIGTANQGIELRGARIALDTYAANLATAQALQPADPQAPSKAGPGTTGADPKPAGGPAILLTVSGTELGMWDPRPETQQTNAEDNQKYYGGIGEQVNQLLAAFMNGTLPSQNGTPPSYTDQGAGFSWSNNYGNDATSSIFNGTLTITATVVTNYDPSQVAARSEPVDPLLQQVLGGGKLVGGSYQGACNWSMSSLIPIATS